MPKSFLGWPSLCLRVRDLEASRNFYSRLGLELISEVPNIRVILGLGGFRLMLMTVLEENVINLRGGDVVQAFDELKAAIPELEGEVEHYAAETYGADADGTCWSTRDPDGNSVFFDTNDTEVGIEAIRRRTLDVLEGAAAELEAMAADPRVVEDLRQRVIGPYLGRE